MGSAAKGREGGGWQLCFLPTSSSSPPPLPDPNADAFLQAQPEIAGHAWVKCFDSDTDDASTPAAFHAQCDAFAETVSIARNSLGFTFGGYVCYPALPLSFPRLL